MKLHIVSFQVPYPPTYGGLVDVYFKLKALKDAGCSIILHTYKYRTDESPELLSVVEKVIYYTRETGITSQLSYLPYIVFSRKNRSLLENLNKDNFPILFEGLHTCYYLDHKSLRRRFKLVRAHNVEHDYYKHLGYSSKSLIKRCYYFLEAVKLRFFEDKLKFANGILAITPADQHYFNQHYPLVSVNWVPCFYNNTLVGKSEGTDDYVLYHGNLSVDENIFAVMFILNHVVPVLGNDVKFIIAGHAPVTVLVDRVNELSNVEIIEDPSEEVMNRLIARARINLLLTFQDTGIKLKLIHALHKGNGYCLVNSPMITDEGLRPLCIVADEARDIADKIRTLHDTEPDNAYIAERTRHLQMLYDNHANACKILSLCER